MRRSMFAASILAAASVFSGISAAQACTFPADWVRGSPQEFREAKYNEHFARLHGCVQNDLRSNLGQPNLVLTEAQLSGLHKYARAAIDLADTPKAHFGFMLSAQPGRSHTMLVIVTQNGRHQQLSSSF